MDEYFNIDLADKIYLEVIFSSVVDDLKNLKSPDDVISGLIADGLDRAKAEEFCTIVAEDPQKGEKLISQLRNEIMLNHILKENAEKEKLSPASYQKAKQEDVMEKFKKDSLTFMEDGGLELSFRIVSVLFGGSFF